MTDDTSLRRAASRAYDLLPDEEREGWSREEFMIDFLEQQGVTDER